MPRPTSRHPHFHQTRQQPEDSKDYHVWVIFINAALKYWARIRVKRVIEDGIEGYIEACRRYFGTTGTINSAPKLCGTHITADIRKKDVADAATVIIFSLSTELVASSIASPVHTSDARSLWVGVKEIRAQRIWCETKDLCNDF